MTTPDRLGNGDLLDDVLVIRARHESRILAALGPLLTPADVALLARYSTAVDGWSWSAALRVKVWLMQVEEIEEQNEAAWARACA